jgi:RNA polymerase sigma-70 factor (ECF subfamily)
MTSFATSDAVRLPTRWADPEDRAAATVEWRPTLEGTYRSLAPSVLGYFRSYGLAVAEDLTGDVFVSVAKGLRRFRGDEHDLRRWVFSIARRRLVDHFRRRRVRSIVTSGDLPEQGVQVDMGDLDVDLVAALRELTEPQREVIVLRFIADLPLEDVARLVGRTVGSVKALQARALAQLEQMLEPRVTANVG